MISGELRLPGVRLLVAVDRLIESIAHLVSEQAGQVHGAEAVRHVGQELVIEFPVVDLEDSEIDDSNGVPDHGLWVIGEPLRHEQQRKVLHLGVVEELNGVLIQAEGE